MPARSCPSTRIARIASNSLTIAITIIAALFYFAPTAVTAVQTSSLLKDDHSGSTLGVISDILGWGYFFAWSISFWPQVIYNFQRKSVSGFSLEFIAYNITGFLFYSTYLTVDFVVQHNDNRYATTVEPNDLAFGYHAVLLTLVNIIQIIMYKSERQTVHWAHAYIISVMWILAGYTLILALSSFIPVYAPYDNNGAFSFVGYLGYTKVVISCVKYMPQAYLNYSRQSTVGWSIGNILLDFTGGTLSFAQQIVDCINDSTWDPLFGNVPKFLLALESVAFDVLFMVQHYVLYTDRTEVIDEEMLNKDSDFMGIPGSKGEADIFEREAVISRHKKRDSKSLKVNGQFLVDGEGATTREGE